MPAGGFFLFNVQRAEYFMLFMRFNQVFWDTTVGRQILTLDLFYRKISDAQRTFIDSASQHGIELACPSGCGNCCHGFMPDVLPIEADYIAYYLLSNDKAFSAAEAPSLQIASSAENPSPCPFHDPDRPGENCRIYPARPLVCRLFGFAGTKDKNGEPSFRLCRCMPTPQRLDVRILDQKDLIGKIGALPPIMSDFAMEVLSLDPSQAAERKPLVEAIRPALAKIGTTLEYCRGPNAA